MKKLKELDLVFTRVPVEAYCSQRDNRIILPAGSEVSVLNPAVPTVSRYFQWVNHHKRYVTQSTFVLVGWKGSDGKDQRGALYRCMLQKRPVPAEVAKRYLDTYEDCEQVFEDYRESMRVI